MFVKSTMKPKHETIYVETTTSLEETLEKLTENNIDGVPVLKGDEYIGTVTYNRIYKAFFESGKEKDDFLKNTAAGDIAARQDLFIDEDEVFENTLLLVKDSPIVPVLNENKKFIGILTRADVLDQFQSAFGMRKSGVRIAFASSEAEGRIAKLAKIAKQFHENIISLVTFDESGRNVRRIVMKIEKNENIDRFVSKLEQNGFKILDIKED
ncbi:CBS domain-containing protein [Pseudalkalibacillus caeni]|uniref:CBS domain-containing protein n=2 Tax=Exobacillus caeni TaxID=2574798 RepID=A0A5R9EXU9_9BACL|nr:CBS domain-containing protein [Pseudalkalibacillus caeni]TLS35681.1 CBS domain-containing protein [Pseudalkalibacillus caeni]